MAPTFAGGVNAVVFAILDTTLLRPLPYADAERLVSVGNQWKNFDHSALSGDLMFQDIRYGGHALGGGTVKIAPQAKGAVRAHGKLVDTIAVDARLALKRSGFEGDVSLTLARLPIEPFLPKLPGKFPIGMLAR